MQAQKRAFENATIYEDCYIFALKAALARRNADPARGLKTLAGRGFHSDFAQSETVRISPPGGRIRQFT
jgi:hypothetical protein